MLDKGYQNIQQVIEAIDSLTIKESSYCFKKPLIPGEDPIFQFLKKHSELIDPSKVNLEFIDYAKDSKKKQSAKKRNKIIQIQTMKKNDQLLKMIQKEIKQFFEGDSKYPSPQNPKKID